MSTAINVREHALSEFWRRMIVGFVRNSVGPALPLRVIGAEHVPADGPLIVVANHLSNADPPILIIAFPR
ncbi:MAG: 1-acyl-sn-glycerol-3-phosphate acyltransferase, partial [Thermomicrobiales bacterium]